MIIHPAFQQGELRKAVFWAYDQFYNRTGPAIHRLARHWITGAKRFKNSPNAGLRRRAAILAERARTARTILLETGSYLPTDAVRETVRQTLAWIGEEVGAPTSAEEAQARLVKRIFDVEMAKREVYPPEPIEPNLKYRRWISGIEVPVQFARAA